MFDSLIYRFGLLPVFTRRIILACVVSYFLVSIGILDRHTFELNAAAVGQGNYVHLFGTLFTHVFIHSNLTHLITNMIFFMAVAVGLETRVGAKQTAIVFFAGALLAGTWIVLAMTLSNHVATAVIPANGASAALTAVMGAALISSRDAICFAYDRFSFKIAGCSVNVPAITVRSWMIVAGYIAQNILGLWSQGLQEKVYYAATSHLIGFAVGIAVMFVLSYGRKNDSSETNL